MILRMSQTFSRRELLGGAAGTFSAPPTLNATPELAAAGRSVARAGRSP